MNKRWKERNNFESRLKQVDSQEVHLFEWNRIMFCKLCKMHFMKYCMLTLKLRTTQFLRY